MILLTLAGNSKRFFDKGYKIVKYKLKIEKVTIIEKILEFIPKNEKIIIVLNRKFDDYIFIQNIMIKLNFKKFKIIEINDTRGQLETVYLGLINSKGFWNSNENLTIYNGDTIRLLNNWIYEDCDGLIEVFKTEGDHWSFVDTIGIVNKVEEKNRISEFCSSGLYYFKSIKLIIDNFNPYVSNNENELFIAPFYNYLIKKNYLIKSELTTKNNFIFCGTPEEYCQSIKK